MKKVKVKHVDAFTSNPQAGNPAGVVLDCEHLSDQQMQRIAREMNLSETAFILPATTSEADMRLRWFTPTVEVPLCGHATVASFHSLAEEGRFGMSDAGDYHFRVETASGILPIEVHKNNFSNSIMFGMPVPRFESAVRYKNDVTPILGIKAKDFEPNATLMAAGYLYVPIKRLHVLFEMKPDFHAMDEFLRMHDWGGMCTYTLETIDRNSVVHSRFFAPNCGINEDPVTGSANGPLVALLYQRGLLQMQSEKQIFQCEQGDAIGRPGRVSVELHVQDGTPAAVRVGGQAITILDGEMLFCD